MSERNIVIGIDPSMNNWGAAVGVVDGEKLVKIRGIYHHSYEIKKGKTVRQNSQDLRVAQSGYAFVRRLRALWSEHVRCIFVEIPVGSQNARAMASYGICIGVIAALREHFPALIEVTPTQVKLSSVGKKTATKAEMIEWATRTWPEANWPTREVKGEDMIIAGQAEHIADACAAIVAGLRTDEYRALSAMAGQHALS